jgi:Fur family transcriptional regulator, ferric uptake regulator
MTSITPATGSLTADALAKSLDQAGYRMTDARRAVIELILSRDGAFDTSDLVADARRRRVPAARATIFRTLEILTDIKAVERLDLPNGDHSYIRCDTGHHHHVVCSSCGRSVDLGDCGMRQVAAEVAMRTGFQIDRHRVELFGLCPSCQLPLPA